MRRLDLLEKCITLLPHMRMMRRKLIATPQTASRYREKKIFWRMRWRKITFDREEAAITADESHCASVEEASDQHDHLHYSCLTVSCSKYFSRLPPIRCSRVTSLTYSATASNPRSSASYSNPFYLQPYLLLHTGFRNVCF